MTNEHDASKHGRDASMHEHDASNEAETTLHEKLCAYILGEADDDERAEVERALSSSAELRAERDRLELTIGFVRDAMTDVEKLSPQATADVISAASVKKSRPWYFSMPMRIAAGIAAVGFLYAVSRNSDHRDSERIDDRVARLDDSRASRAEKRARSLESESARGLVAADANEGASGELSRLKGLGYTRDSDGKNNAPAAAAGAVANEAKAEAVIVAQAPSAGRLQRVTDEVAASSPTTEADASQYKQRLDAPRESMPNGGSTGGHLNSRDDSPHTNESVAAAVASESKASGSYRGPGDSLPPSAPVGATIAPIAAAGEAGAGPTGPSTGGPTAFGGRTLGHGQSKAPPSSDSLSMTQALAKSRPADRRQVRAKDGASDELSRLDRLGYVDGSDDSGAMKELQDKLKKYRPEHKQYEEILSDFERLKRDRELTAEEREVFLDQQCRLILERCRRQPNEKPRDMYFRFWGDNAFQIAALEAQSTFSADVDTASYALARRYLNEGQLPEKAQVRTEEFINYFKPDVAAPREGTFAIQTELAPSRFSNDAVRTMLRVVVRGREVTKQERKPLALTFVIDCSGSMVEQGRLEMVKHAIRLLLSQLDANDSIAIVAFSSDARMILPMTSAKQRDLIESALFPLKPENSTNSEAGLRMGFEAALTGLNPNANNRVVFLSDGVANIGETNPEKLAEGVKRIREKGIYLNSIGVGMNNHNDALLEQLADKGDGVCNYIDSMDEAKRVMVDNFTGAMETIARDVKIQVEFDPTQVYRYRLLGYENRFIANQDFRNDKVDAGEVGAGHQVCALYELELANPATQSALAGKAAQDAAPKPLATVRLRWKAPRDVRHPDANEEATEMERSVLAPQTTSYEGSSFGYKRAVVVAQFAEFLRRSTHARGRSFDDLIAEAKQLEKQAEDKEFSELVTLLEKSRSLILANLPQCDELCQTIDVIRRNQILRAEHDLLSVERDQKALDDLAKQNTELEARIRELLRRKLQERSK